MSQARKRYEKMRGNPAGDWRIEDIEVVCRAHGVACDPPAGGGSHFTLSHPNMAEILTVPAKRPIKPVYIRNFVTYIEALKGKLSDGQS